MSQPTQAVRVQHTPSGGTAVTVTLKQDGVTASWRVKHHTTSITTATIEAQGKAFTALQAARKAID